MFAQNIPLLDLKDFLKGDLRKRERFVRDLGNAFTEVGFVAVKNHGLSDELAEKLYSAVKNFFLLPYSIKRKYEFPELHGQRGYTGKGREHAKGRDVGDLKEFFHIGQDGANEYTPNIWADEVPELKTYGLLAYRALENCGMDLLRAIALYLHLEESYFDDKVQNGNSILRPIHYYPIDEPEKISPDAVRAAEHEDINLITLLMGASAEGLQLLTKEGNWVDITALPEQIVVNVSDMLQRLTNDKLCSTTHRVVNPPIEKMKMSRHSIPFFLHPRMEMSLSCLETCVDKTHPKKYSDMTAGEYLNERLAEIGLKKY